MIKCKFTDETKEFNGITLYRIEFTEDCIHGKKGDKGGWMESTKNLTSDKDGWIQVMYLW